MCTWVIVCDAHTAGCVWHVLTNTGCSSTIQCSCRTVSNMYQLLLSHSLLCVLLILLSLLSLIFGEYISLAVISLPFMRAVQFMSCCYFYLQQNCLLFSFYEHHSINKLQNGVILLIFRVWKFQNIHFVGDLILSMCYEFYYDYVTVTSFINITYGNIAVEFIPQGTAFCYSFAVGKRT